jgi:flagellar biosynthesis/type III secretory pathway protein FliH
LYRERYPQEAATMTGFADRFREEGMQLGMQQGMQQGEANMLIHLLERRFGELPGEARREIQSADVETLLRWSERVLTAESLDEVLD